MKQSRKTPIILLVLSLLGVLLAATAPALQTAIQFKADTDLLSIPNGDVSVSFVAWLVASGRSTI